VSPTIFGHSQARELDGGEIRVLVDVHRHRLAGDACYLQVQRLIDASHLHINLKAERRARRRLDGPLDREAPAAVLEQHGA